MKKIYSLLFVFFLFLGSYGQQQTSMFLSGDFNSWGADAMTFKDLGSTDTWILTRQYTGSTAYLNFKFRDASDNWTNNWGAGDNILIGVKATIYKNGGNCSASHQQNKFYTYIIKDVNDGANSDGVLFQTDQTPVTVSSTSRTPSTVYGYQKPIVYATLSGSMPNGQGVYVRYTTNGWSSSTTSQMVLFEGDTYKLELPPYASGTTVQYYILTSGSSLTISHADADLFTINLLNNGGSNYTYTVQSGTVRFSGNNGNWSSTSSWEGGIKPSSSDQVVIQHNIVLDEISTITVNNLLINQDKTLTINSSQSLTITNELGNNGALLIKSGATGTGSLIHNTAGVNATVERYISGGWGSADAGWHQISSPVSSQAISSFETTGAGNGYDFYGWDELTNMWMNYKDGGFSTWNGGTSFNVGQGYLISYETTQTGKSFSGALNTADVTKTNLTRTGPSVSAGFHLLGNPFASAVKWNDGNWALTDVAGTAKIWNEGNKSYSDIAANGYIPSAQGFMVQVADGTNNITIPAASREHNNTAWYKSTNDLERIFLKATENEGGSAQESQVLINPSASEQFDFDFDSRFLAGYAPQFYSTAGGEMLSTNTLPFLAAETVVPFGFVKNDASNFSIELAESMAGYTVYLTDLKNGTEQNLSVNPVYAFTAEAGDDPNRFLLHFGTVGINKPVEDTQVSILVRDNNLLISGAAANAEIVVTNLLGQVVLQGKAGNSGLTVISTGSLNDGIYVVSVVSGKQSVSKKISLR